jgi:hypothetical protein
MFSYFKRKDTKAVFAKMKITISVTAEEVEHIVARYHRDITTQREMRSVIRCYFRDNGCEYPEEYLSHDQDELILLLNEARVTVKKYMPELYM